MVYIHDLLLKTVIDVLELAEHLRPFAELQENREREGWKP